MKSLMSDYRSVNLSAVDRALCDYAIKLTRAPAAMEQTDVDELRRQGLSDRAINDAVQVISFFNYINRVAEGLGVDLEPEMLPKESAGNRI